MPEPTPSRGSSPPQYPSLRHHHLPRLSRRSRSSSTPQPRAAGSFSTTTARSRTRSSSWATASHSLTIPTTPSFSRSVGPQPQRPSLLPHLGGRSGATCEGWNPSGKCPEAAGRPRPGLRHVERHGPAHPSHGWAQGFRTEASPHATAPSQKTIAVLCHFVSMPTSLPLSSKHYGACPVASTTVHPCSSSPGPWTRL